LQVLNPKLNLTSLCLWNFAASKLPLDIYGTVSYNLF
jgi:hypothetical protein